MTLHDFNGKKILVLGLGLHGGGVETVKFFLSKGAHLTVTDRRTKKELWPALKEIAAFEKSRGLARGRVKYTLSEHRESDLRHQDFVVKNPAIPPASPWLLLAKEKKIPVISDLGIFFLNSAAPIIGVTGTRGKSTTAYLISRFLQESGLFKNRVFLGGNIRRSVLEFLPRLRKKDVVILELSSFQLYDLKEVGISPHIAVVTNIYRDHLNWHKTFRNYVESKKNIFRFQKKNDYLFLNPDDQILKEFGKETSSRVRYARLKNEHREIIEKNLGRHYNSSVALAIAVAKFLRVGENSIKNTLRKFRGLEGRQEEVAVIKGVHFINDTTSTIPEATIAALERFGAKISNLGRGKIVLIAGGQDKNLNFKKWISSIKKIADVAVFLPGTATDKIKSKFREHGFNDPSSYFVYSMKNAVRKAFSRASAGDYIILSPGAASFGLFLNEFDRGKKFVECIRRLEADS